VRTGIGYDIHRLKRGRRFLLAGAEIPYFKGEDGHSDGDVLAHAVCDAILGASAMGDIGGLFPSNNPAYKDADSMDLLRKAFSCVKKEGWKVASLDCVIICDNPKVLPFRDVIRNSLAAALEMPFDCVFVKGKTTEGFRKNAVEAYAVCLLEKQ